SGSLCASAAQGGRSRASRSMRAVFMAPFNTIRPVKATGAFRGSFQTLDSAMQRKWHGVCSLVFMNKKLISTALAILALYAAAASAVAQDVNAKAKASASVSADIERRGNQIRRSRWH